MYKIGVLLDSELIQAWQVDSIRQILNSGLAEIPVLIINKSPQTLGGRSPFLYRLYRKLDRILFKSREDAFKSISIFSVLDPKTSKVFVHPSQTKYRDEFEKKDLEKIKELDLDILLRFGFRILKGEILFAAKLGVWSFHHGDPAFYRGGPPAFWEVMNSKPTTAAVLMRINEKLDQGTILYKTTTQTDPLSVQRNANKLFWASSFFVSRVLMEINSKGIEQWEKGLSPSSTNIIAPLWKPPGTFSLVQLVSSLIIKNSIRKWKELFQKPHWQIARVGKLKNKSLLELGRNETEIWEHPNPSKHYLADPFAHTFNGKEYLFVEEFDKASQIGRISYVEKINAKIQITPVIEEEWHLSYPFIFELENTIFMIPEAAHSEKVYLYKAIDFPLKWQRKIALFPKEAYDPTLVKKDGLFWLFVNQKSHDACSSFDELYLYWCTDLKNPTWNPHPQNPIVSDVTSARPAGKPFQENWKWFRPAQDSGLRYGHQVQIQEIVTWSKEEYQEKTIQTITPASGFLGIHTFNKTGQSAWIDFHSKR
ncbi:hypothetical protein JYB64_09005 [Algoriphagus aestuarii]|nr:hypothetical protein [Algoriphagus aestuarii]